ncbi:MAG TPA: DUF1761 domain-containing protein [Candidatus Nanoarchaeia archaeon]|nr:DUF1761 domain-containing protein [Candidatus Nanoarchaeia archaeon]
MGGINYAAVLVAAAVSFAIGFLWYSEILFGNLWVKLSGIAKKDAKKAKKQGMWKSAVASLISYFVMAGVLSSIIVYIGKTPAVGAFIGVLSWLGFIATTTLGGVLWEGKSIKLYLFNNAYHLVSLVVMGLIIGAW